VTTNLKQIEWEYVTSFIWDWIS